MTTQTDPNENAWLAVRRAQQQFWSALQGKDRQAFEQLLADDFVSRSPGQPNQGRVEFIDTLTGFPARVLSVGSDNLEVHVWGDIAVVTGVQFARLQWPDGQEKMDKIAITNVFQEQQGHWILKLAHAIPLE
jgi:ketosteroid isomerase-like protein